jgi:hypothetical protein
MANQKFSAILREAIWIAHSKRCAYTHELVDLASMHVDHIIPEHLATKPDEFAAVRATLGLPADFELFGLENLLPAKPGANLQKGDLTLNAAGAHFFLNIAASKKAVTESNINKINRRLQSGRAFIMIQQMFESGKITRIRVQIPFPDTHPCGRQREPHLVVTGSERSVLAL